ncbi:uncharacterized protein A4U43_C01F23860 [Asparagus officinalis]|uniref:Leucine-rich repeat-containing N-terminal plant-type domain-containing protein n=1 Tax=Asparagus officinalis TaxID=4686 RepID=A0A5P1FTH0_ASPOF|nr:uncharacterized protein A4U43_C01F23860 [Asparagus officinalis]
MHFKELFHRFGERFPDLRILRLSSNKFSGQIPSQISNLSSLQVFDFAENDFIGTTLESLGDLKARASSRKINPCLLYGKYRGTYYEERLLVQIPSTGQFPTFSASSYSRNKFLCGAPLTVQCERSSSREKESRDDTDGAIRDKWLSLSIGLGLAVGLLGLLAVGLIAVVSIKKKHGILLTSSMWIG